jgi:hypothetical protein
VALHLFQAELLFSTHDYHLSSELNWLAYFNLMLILPFFDWYSEFLFNVSTMDAIHCTEWDNTTVGYCIVD